MGIQFAVAPLLGVEQLQLETAVCKEHNKSDSPASYRCFSDRVGVHGSRLLTSVHVVDTVQLTTRKVKNGDCDQ